MFYGLTQHKDWMVTVFLMAVVFGMAWYFGRKNSK